jgi:hypothetical protein
MTPKDMFDIIMEEIRKLKLAQLEMIRLLNKIDDQTLPHNDGKKDCGCKKK